MKQIKTKTATLFSFSCFSHQLFQSLAPATTSPPRRFWLYRSNYGGSSKVDACAGRWRNNSYGALLANHSQRLPRKDHQVDFSFVFDVCLIFLCIYIYIAVVFSCVFVMYVVAGVCLNYLVGLFENWSLIWG